MVGVVDWFDISRGRPLEAWIAWIASSCQFPLQLQIKASAIYSLSIECMISFFDYVIFNSYGVRIA